MFQEVLNDFPFSNLLEQVDSKNLATSPTNVQVGANWRIKDFQLKVSNLSQIDQLTLRWNICVLVPWLGWPLASSELIHLNG